MKGGCRGQSLDVRGMHYLENGDICIMQNTDIALYGLFACFLGILPADLILNRSVFSLICSVLFCHTFSEYAGLMSCCKILNCNTTFEDLQLKKQQSVSCQKKQNLANSTTLKFLLIFSVGENPFLIDGIFSLYGSTTPYRVLAFSTNSFHLLLSWARIFQFGTFIFCISFLTSFPPACLWSSCWPS